MGAELLDFGNCELPVIESQIVDHSFEGSALLLVSNLQRSGRADRPAEAVGENLGLLYFSVQVNLESRALPRAVVVQDELMSASGVEGLAEALFRPDFDGVVRPLVDQSDRQVSAEPEVSHRTRFVKIELIACAFGRWIALLDQGSLDLVQGPGLAETHGDGKWRRPLKVAGVAEVNVRLTVESACCEVSPFVKGHFSAPRRGWWMLAGRIRQAPFHFVVRDHARARRLWNVGKSRLLPFGLEPLDLFLRHRRLELAQFQRELFQLAFLFRRRELHNRLRVTCSPVKPFFGDVVEESVKPVEILLLEGI